MRSLIGSLFCALFLCAPVMRSLNAEEFKSILPDGFTVSGAFGFGRYDTDLEQRYRDDIFTDALLQPAVNPGTSGVGYGSPWQNKEHGGLSLDVGYRATGWFAGYEAYVAGAKPQYQGVTFLRNGGNTTTSVDDGAVSVLARANGTFYGGIPVGLGKNLSMDVFAGFRALVVHAEYDSTLLSSTLSNTGARADAVGITLDSTSDSRAVGLVFGIEGQWKLNERIHLRISAAVFQLSGDWLLEKVNASGASAGGVLTGGAQLVHEDGNYQVKGGQISFAAYYALDTDLSIFAALTAERSQTRDSAVLRYDTNNFSNPPRLMLDYLLSTQGTRNPDAFGALRIGAEKRIHW